VRLEELARTSEAVARTRARSEKIDLLAATLRALRPAEIASAVTLLSGTLPRLGVGWAALRELPEPATNATLDVGDVAASLELIGAATGPGAQDARTRDLHDLFAQATAVEHRFLRGVLQGELRQGALEGLATDAVARAADVPVVAVRRALMLAGTLPPVAEAALIDGADGLARFRLEVLRPVKPMLAQSADDLASGLERTGPAAAEWKLDGARLQVHRLRDEVRAFTRSLADVTDRVPEVVAAVRALPLDAAVLDGEVIALRADGRPYPFQDSMSRFAGGSDEDAGADRRPLSSFFFDCLHVDGTDLLDRPYRERVAELERVVPDEMRVPRVEVANAEEGAYLLDDALARGHEGVVLKSLEAPYEAGRRGAAWVKVKRAATLDLVVLAAEWGHGRRQGKLSNLHLGARDPAGDGFVMLGKTFKGMTDAMLAWQTEHLLALATSREAHVVHVRPELVVEIACDGVQASSRYPGGVALRFARVKGYRTDKHADEADTIDVVRALQSGG
jgi:ATP-dependent DNA ligase I